MKKGLNILYTIECYLPIISGSGIATKRIATGLAKRGHRVAVACPGKGFGVEKNIEDGVIVYRLSSIPVLIYREYYFSPFARRFMDNIFDEFKPDIVNLEDHFFISTAAYVEANKRGIPVIGTNHFHPGNILPHSKIKKGTSLYRVMERRFWASFVKLFNRLAVVTTPTNIAAEIIRNAGLTKPSIYVVSNGISVEYFGGEGDLDEKDFGSEKDYASCDEEVSRIVDKYGIDKKSTILISVSRLEKEKRVDVLIKALSMIKEKVSFQFLVVGKGKERPNLERMAKKCSISDRVIFTGYVSDSELLILYRLSDVFLTASEIELQGLSIMEAMASSLPVVASSSMAIPELVKDGVNGFLFQPGNSREASEKILLLLKDKELRRRMGENSKKLIMEHDFEHTLDEFEKLYYSLLGSTLYARKVSGS